MDADSLRISTQDTAEALQREERSQKCLMRWGETFHGLLLKACRFKMCHSFTFQLAANAAEAERTLCGCPPHVEEARPLHANEPAGKTPVLFRVTDDKLHQDTWTLEGGVNTAAEQRLSTSYIGGSSVRARARVRACVAH